DEAPMDRFNAVTADLLDLSKAATGITTVYNAGLLGAMSRFKTTYESLAARFPKLNISYFYATKGDEPHPNVRRKVEMLEQTVTKLFSSAPFNFSFLGAKELLALARRSPKETHALKLSENPISSSGAVGFVCLVKLRDFFTFMTDENGK